MKVNQIIDCYHVRVVSNGQAIYFLARAKFLDEYPEHVHLLDV